MRTFPTAKIRNVALAGHSGTGKTTLLEAMLATTGQIDRAGSVPAGSTVSDYEPEEARRQMSLGLSVAPVLHAQHKLNVVDLPGYLDFEADQQAGMGVADLVLILVSGSDGIEAGTEAAWELAQGLGRSVAFCVTKLDRDRADFPTVLGNLRARFGSGVVPLDVPAGNAEEVRAGVDLLASAAADVDGDLAAWREALLEAAVISDEALMERYLEGEALSPADLLGGLRAAVTGRTAFPVTWAVGPVAAGVEVLLDRLRTIAPSPDQVGPRRALAGGQDLPVPCDAAGPTLATVYKTVVDPYVGQLSYLRVLSGTIHPDVHLVNPRSGSDERLHGLFILQGSDHLGVESLEAGDLGAVAKLSDTATGDSLAQADHPALAVWPPWPQATYATAIRPHSDSDDDKLMTALHRLQSEDPSLRVERNDETHQSLLWGMGETHLGVAIERLHRRFGVQVDTEEVKVAYRETVTGAAEAEGRHKKQSGGHGQFGVVSLRIEPLERGEGFQFVDQVVGGAIPHQFITAVEKGVIEAMSTGGDLGFPVTDIRATVFDGKTHPVDSSELSFKLAASLAFRNAFSQARPVLLEPVSDLVVDVPTELQGDIMGDLNSRRGRVHGTEATAEGRQVISAHVPTSEVRRYAIDLRSLTGGRGRFRARHSHYDPVPTNLTSRLVGAGA